MPRNSEAITNHYEHSEGSNNAIHDDSSIDLESLGQAAEQSCECSCCGGTRGGHCGCASRLARPHHVRVEGSRAHYPGQGGTNDAMPSQPMNIPDGADARGCAESYDSDIEIGNNSIDAPHPLTQANLQAHTARSLGDKPRHHHYHAAQRRGSDDDDDHPLAIIAADPGMEDWLATGEMDEHAVDGSMLVEREHASQSMSLSMSMSMLSDWNRPLTRSSPSASVYLPGLRQVNYMRSPLRLVPECSHAQMHGCGCYRGA